MSNFAYSCNLRVLVYSRNWDFSKDLSGYKKKKILKMNLVFISEEEPVC